MRIYTTELEIASSGLDSLDFYSWIYTSYWVIFIAELANTAKKIIVANNPK